ncbi:hypothetical protein F2Q68_00037352 [Brassica cretica]|uniref:Uncharacterized protein n=1 Tax=Brassica cretica TaxID=69181 RepID=A0A8S9H149_BRACR|nr:hypothetical protein F2Q68_00037352 [Brassica cretica]
MAQGETVEEVAYSSHHVYDARRSETRIKEKTSYLPPVIVGKLNGTPPSNRAIPMKSNSLTIFTVVQVAHRIYVSKRMNRLQSIPPPSIFLLEKQSPLIIRGSSKIKLLTTRRGSDEIETEEREAIRLRRAGNIDQRNRENPGVKPLSPSRRARRGVENRTAPSKRPQATGVRSWLYSSN